MVIVWSPRRYANENCMNYLGCMEIVHVSQLFAYKNHSYRECLLLRLVQNVDY